MVDRLVYSRGDPYFNQEQIATKGFMADLQPVWGSNVPQKNLRKSTAGISRNQEIYFDDVISVSGYNRSVDISTDCCLYILYRPVYHQNYMLIGRNNEWNSFLRI